MRRTFLCLCLALLASLLLASPAAAGRSWCARDPIVVLNGRTVQVWVAIPEEYVPLVNGPIEVQFQTPAGMTRSVALTDEGFNGHGEVVSFSEDLRSRMSLNGDFSVRIWVAVPIDESRADSSITASKIPTLVTVIDGDQRQELRGWSSGSWLTTRIGNETS
jgi:hypothetical protein